MLRCANVSFNCSSDGYSNLTYVFPSCDIFKLFQSTWQTRHPMVVLDTRMPRGALMSGCEERKDQSGSFLNEGEADIVCTHVTSLIAAGKNSPKLCPKVCFCLACN